jgi:hypothetical protein
MTQIDVSITVLGMSGAYWTKVGRCETPQRAHEFLEYWWDRLSMPESWVLEIDGTLYNPPPYTKEDSERQIMEYCRLHQETHD